ncbi:hypothetical protein [Qipengyuania sp.]|uniref:hypothetical protein n=1 Tax=Qipengyuania sp. TaxID=2004515 RepID=UPI003AF8A972
MIPEFSDPAAQGLWNDYVAQVDRMVALIGPEAAELSEDLRAHLADSFASDTSGSEVDRIQRAIERLGQPSEFLRPMLADELLERGARTYDPALISRGLYHTIRSGSRRAFSAIAFAAGYILLANFAAMTLFKPFFSDHVGLIRGPNGSLTFGIVGDGAGEELLGLWSIPLTLALCALLYVLLTRALRRYGT